MFPDPLQETEQFRLPEGPGREEGRLGGADQRVGGRQEEGGVLGCVPPLSQALLTNPLHVVLSPVVRLHHSLQVLGVLGQDGQPEVVRVEVGQDGHDEARVVLRDQPVPGEKVRGLVTAQAVTQLLRGADGLLPLLHLKPLLRQHRQLPVVALAGEVLLHHVDILEDILENVLLDNGVFKYSL